jgi:hypothetical protein
MSVHLDKESMEIESLCHVCGKPDDSNNAEGPCLECQADQQAYEIDRIYDMVRNGDSGIARALMHRRKLAKV